MEKEIKEKKSKVPIIITIIVCVLFAIIGYFGGNFIASKVSSLEKKSDVKSSDKDETETIKEEKIDINSRVVKNLYDMVSINSMNGSCYADWLYNDSTSGGDFIAAKDEQIKMNIVGNNLAENERSTIDCSEKIPSEVESENIKGYRSICAFNEALGSSDFEYIYSKEYIETIYKKIFGNNVKLNTSYPIFINHHKTLAYYYVSSIDKYVLYRIDGGGSCGLNSTSLTIEKAIMKNDEIKIYEKANKYDESNEEVETNIYTFKLEDDGMYSFVSRVREK